MGHDSLGPLSSCQLCFDLYEERHPTLMQQFLTQRCHTMVNGQLIGLVSALSIYILIILTEKTNSPIRSCIHNAASQYHERKLALIGMAAILSLSVVVRAGHTEIKSHELSA